MNVGEFTTILCCLFGSSRELSKNIGECSTHLRASQVSGTLADPEIRLAGNREKFRLRPGAPADSRCGAMPRERPIKYCYFWLEGGVLPAALIKVFEFVRVHEDFPAGTLCYYRKLTYPFGIKAEMYTHRSDRTTRLGEWVKPIGRGGEYNKNKGKLICGRSEVGKWDAVSFEGNALRKTVKSKLYELFVSANGPTHSGGIGVASIWGSVPCTLFDHQSQAASGAVSSWMGGRLGTRRGVGFFWRCIPFKFVCFVQPARRSEFKRVRATPRPRPRRRPRTSGRSCGVRATNGMFTNTAYIGLAEFARRTT
ncbi:hypothetical protein EVAR_102006_1 [Eumeta japonica]|uniref:Uncharacterized protein n=1 Tax=Eumeta variegata TaxID=151549 RepID=A0A4C2AF79_EUMVA|nr:hypothetical protein EVAR_102006_1 [Eumeta japonica]